MDQTGEVIPEVAGDEEVLPDALATKTGLPLPERMAQILLDPVSTTRENLGRKGGVMEMNRWVTIALILALWGVAATPASAEIGEKAKNTGVNLFLGAGDCPKAWGDEISRGGARSVVGALVTGPLMCGTNVAVRYLGVAGDILTLPWGDNLVKPNALDRRPPVRLP